jgi:hypothetical protein
MLLVLLISGTAAADRWRPPNASEIVMLGIQHSLIIVDVWQTLDLRNHPEAIEVNPLLGKHPSTSVLLLAGAGSIAATSVAWYALPPPWRSFLPGVVSVILFRAVVVNRSNGMVMRF